MNLPAKKVDIVNLKGGIDRASTFLNIPPGAALDLLNFGPQLEGGYERIYGYERVDGRAAPSAAVYYTVGVADASGISVGATLTGATSGATSKVVIKDGNTLGVTAKSVAGYTLSEVANGTTITAVELLSGQNDYDDDAVWQLAAEDYYRALIGAVTGDGDALYAFQLGAIKYAFRADSGTVKLYKTSATGWTLVPYYSVLFWDGGVLADGDVAVGDTITGATSAATGTVKKYVKNAGSYGSTASGYMVIQVTSGTYQNNENLQKGGVTKMVADGASAAITVATGGTWQHIEHNFYATTSTKSIYLCDGVNPAYEFDGTTLCPIYYPAPDEHPSWNKPTYIAAHRMHLFLSYAPGTVAHSSPGDPLILSAILGASEFGLGDIPTGMVSRAGEVLALYTQNKTFGLYGTDSSNWELKTISESFGAKPYTVQALGSIYALDVKGIAPLDRVDAYGDFESATVSRFVKPIIDEKIDSVIASVAVRNKNQYWLFFDDGSGLIMGDDQYLGESLPAFTRFQLFDTPTFVSSSEDASGNQVILMGDSSGYIYEMNVGYNFDGEAIEFAYRSPFMHQNAPHIRKRFMRLFVDLDAQSNLTLQISHELGYGRATIPANLSTDVTAQTGGGYFAVDDWDEFFWDATTFSSEGVVLAGTANNISITLYGNSALIRPFTIQTLELHYLPRTIRRA